MARSKRSGRAAPVAAVAMAALLAAGCGDVWLGAAEDPPLPGARVAIMATDTDIQPDPALAGAPILVPPPALTSVWAGAGGGVSRPPQHLTLAKTPRRLWSVATGAVTAESAAAALVVVEGRIYVVDAAYRVSAYGAGDGARQWRTASLAPERDRDAFGGGLAYWSGRLFLTTGYGGLYALDPRSGAILWSRNVSMPIHAPPAAFGETLITVSVDNQVAAWSVVTGESLWRNHSAPAAIAVVGGAAAAIQAPFVIAPTSAGDVLAFGLDSGRLFWERTLAPTDPLAAASAPADIRSAPVIDGDEVYVVSRAERLAALSLQTGAVLWERRIGGITTPWLTGDTLFVLAEKGQLVALSRRDGRVRWRTDLPAWENPDSKAAAISWTGPILAGGRLLLGNSVGAIWEIAPQDGAVLSRIEVDAPIRTPLASAAGVLYVQTATGRLSAFR